MECKIGRKQECLKKGRCEWSVAFYETCPGFKKNFPVKDLENINAIKEFIKPAENFYYLWVGQKSGIVWGIFKDYKPNGLPGEKFKYMGYSKDSGWPKKLNTGRVIFFKSRKGSYPKKSKK